MQLYPHQRAGVRFLLDHRRAGLFDDQGLGKTITALVALRQIGPSFEPTFRSTTTPRALVLAPTSVTRNWMAEAHRWWPGVRVQVIVTGADLIDDSAKLIVCPHSLLLSDRIREQLLARTWNTLIVDEAHNFRNAEAKRTKVLYAWKTGLVRRAERVWLLTGTPMPNNDASELWTHLMALAPGRVLVPNTRRPMSWTEFRNRFCVLAPSPYKDGWKVVGPQNVAELRRRVHGFYLRRTKTDHLNLPPIRHGCFALTVDKLPPELDDIAAQLHVDETDPDAVLAALQHHEHFARWRRLCGVAKAKPAAALLAEELRDNAYQKVVVFAHHREVLSSLYHELAGFGCVRLAGDQDATERHDAVTKFQNEPSVRVALCQIVAGGVGVTLTAAHNVVFVEQSFIPGENAQAADRCHRIGQTESVLVRYLTLAGSVDEIVSEILARKATTLLVNS